MQDGDIATLLAGPRAERVAAFDKTKMCKFFILGACTKGANCHFAHTKEQTRGGPLAVVVVIVDFVVFQDRQSRSSNFVVLLPILRRHDGRRRSSSSSTSLSRRSRLFVAALRRS